MQTGLFSLPKKLPSLPYATEWGRHKETTYRGPHGVFENFGQVICLIPKDLRGRLKKKQFKKGCFPGDKRFRSIFTRIIEYDDRQAINLLGSGLFVNNYCGSHKIISVTLKLLLQAQISGNQAIFAVKKGFGRFSSYYRTWRTWRKNLLGPEGMLKIFAEVMR